MILIFFSQAYIPPKPEAPFTQKTPEYKFLKQMFEKGDVLASDKPTDIYYKVDKFQKYTTDQFRSQFNKLKTATGLHTRLGKTIWLLKVFHGEMSNPQ